jgi:hypothetical protein
MKFSSFLPILLAPLAAHALTIPYLVPGPLSKGAVCSSVTEPIATPLSSHTLAVASNVVVRFSGGETHFRREGSMPVVVFEKLRSGIRDGVLKLWTWNTWVFRYFKVIYTKIREGRKNGGGGPGRVPVFTEAEARAAAAFVAVEVLLMLALLTPLLVVSVELLGKMWLEMRGSRRPDYAPV